MPCYAIKDWEKHFENSESRKIKSLTWVPVKNRHDGKGYRRVVSHPKSIQVFCAWNLIIQVASRMPVRGLLRDGDGPLTASDLSFKTGYPEAIFEEAFRVLSDPKIGWLIKVVAEAEMDEIPASPETSGGVRVEQNRTEQKGSIQERENAGAGSQKPKEPMADANLPTWEEVKAIAARQAVTEKVALEFFQHHEGNSLWTNRHGVLINVAVKLQIWAANARFGRPNQTHANPKPTAPDRNAGTYSAGKAADDISTKVR